MSTEVDLPVPPDGKAVAAAATYKLLIIGDSNVGKTSLLNRYCDNSFQGALIATVGIDYKTKYIVLDEQTIKLQIWDTAGQERFRTLTNAYFRGACGAVLLYDITSRDTFTNVASWMESVEEHASSDICIAIVGHKLDLEEERAIATEEGKKLAENYNSLFCEASAKTGQHCSKIFTRLASRIKAEKDSATSTQVYQQSPALDVSDKKSPSRQSSCC